MQNYFVKKKGSNVNKGFNFHSICLCHQYGHGFIVLGHQYGHGFIVLGRGQYCKRGVCNRLILAGEYSRLSSLFVARDVSRE